MTEAEQIQNGIVDLVVQHGIRRLVMGSAPDNCFKLKGSSSKVTYAAKNAPPFCEIWFVCKGRHVWTREASEGTNSFLSVFSPDAAVLHKDCCDPMPNPEYVSSNTFMTADLQGDRGKSNNTGVVVSTDSSIVDSTNLSNSECSPSCPTSPVDIGFLSEINSQDKLEPEVFFDQLKEVNLEVERSKKEAFVELVKRREVETEVEEALDKVKALEAAHAREIKIREELEDLLTTIKLQHKELINQRDETMKELQNALSTIATLDAGAQEMSLRRDEAAAELDLIQSSIAILRLERQKIQEQEEKAVAQLERWRCNSQATSPNCSQLIGFGGDSYNLTEFALSDLESATCGFSGSFKLGQGGYGCVYKGEIFNRSVVIKKLHPHNVQGQMEFQQEVSVLSKLRHPHLVTLVGVCPEALSLVYEYLPNGTLHDRLFCKTTTPSLTWRVRTCIAAQISSALLFLHSSKPEKIIHGDLKPENIFLDSNFNCKIGGFGTCRLVPEDVEYYPLFRRNTERKGAFSYADPQYQRTEMLTPKSDVYSFGIIILQLLTGRPPHGLASEVRRTVLSRKLSSILDPAAGEWPSDVARRLSEFGLQCSELNSRDRPELTPEVVRELEQLHLMEERPVPPFFLCPILQEIMHDPQVAADGFTYEGRALRGWLESGRETSPMTNLKLKHLNLAPNHALRFAIQDWLCHC
ncbi:U-box domain-containing protein 33 isoform X2 [Elaeis guineensis]